MTTQEHSTEVVYKVMIWKNEFKPCSRKYCFSIGYTEITEFITEGHRDKTDFLDNPNQSKLNEHTLRAESRLLIFSG